MSATGTIEVVDLEKRYGHRLVLDGVSFTVPSGQVTGFVGSNGAGKSTTMRILLGLLEADHGTVSVAGRPIDSAYRSGIGYMPEEQGLYPEMRVKDHLVYLARLHGMGRRQARLEVGRWGETLGIDHRFDDVVRELSLGNRQRVQLVAALLGDPTALVLDEPFSGLDPSGVDAMGAVLAETARDGRPILFSSHQLDLMERVCDRVVILHDGRVVAEDTVDGLLDGTENLHVVRTARPVAPGTLVELGADVVSSGRHALTGGLPDPGRHVVRVPAGAEAETIRRITHGVDVISVERARATLSDLYRDAVMQDAH
jgi:ABC-2 type transport system ATP-binding protein